MGRTLHFPDDRLFEAYLAERDGIRVDPPVAEHLDTCPACSARLDELARCMDGLRQDAEAEADAIFTPERLQVQQRQIADRLEHLGQAARIITFPGRLIGRRVARTAARIAPRWAVAAAAAGLFVGVGVGTLVAPTPRPTPVAIAPSPAVPPAVVVVSEPSPVSDDDAFLSELEMALSGPRNRELLPFDRLTPRVQAITTQLR